MPHQVPIHVAMKDKRKTNGKERRAHPPIMETGPKQQQFHTVEQPPKQG